MAGKWNALSPADLGENTRAGEVVDVVEINVAVSVDIGHDATCGPRPRRCVTPDWPFVERSVTVVAVQPVVADVGNVKIRPPIVVNVAHGNALAEAFVAQARRACDIAECPVAVIAVQPIQKHLL